MRAKGFIIVFMLACCWAVNVWAYVGKTDLYDDEGTAAKVDSVAVCDFFWYGFQREAISALGNTNRTLELSGALCGDSVSKRIEDWKRALGDIDIVGDGSDGSCIDSTLGFLRKSVELCWYTGQACYMDVAERLLANAVLKYWKERHGLPADGCDAEVARWLVNVGDLVYRTEGTEDIYINMYVRNNARFVVNGKTVYLQMVNSSPWNNDTNIRFVRNMNMIEDYAEDADSLVQGQGGRIVAYDDNEVDSIELTLHIRVPSWVKGEGILHGYRRIGMKRAQQMQFYVNGEMIIPEFRNGYAVISGRWAVGDYISVKMPSPILRVCPENRTDVVALQRGPLVYCHGNYARGWRLNVDNPIKSEFNQGKEAVILSGELENEYGQKPFVAMPYYLVGDKGQIFLPVK